MTKELYRSADGVSVDGPRGMYVVRKTRKGISVQSISIYDYPTLVSYYHNGSYPQIPDAWDKRINDYGTTAADAWYKELYDNFKPYRTVCG